MVIKIEFREGDNTYPICFYCYFGYWDSHRYMVSKRGRRNQGYYVNPHGGDVCDISSACLMRIR